MEQITFRDLGLSEDILRALDEKGYGYPTKVQEEAIPHLMQWKDMMAKAPTGTGKTFAFGIPMIEHIDETSDELQGLILAPTRELAMQICDEMRGLLAFRKGVRVAVVYGGQAIEKQVKSLQKKPQIVVATPGRLMDHYNRKNLRLDKIHSVVLDEADRMLDMGFFKDVTKILDRIKILQPVTVGFPADRSMTGWRVAAFALRRRANSTKFLNMLLYPLTSRAMVSVSGCSCIHLACTTPYPRTPRPCPPKTSRAGGEIPPLPASGLRRGVGCKTGTTPALRPHSSRFPLVGMRAGCPASQEVRHHGAPSGSAGILHAFPPVPVLPGGRLPPVPRRG